MSPASVAVLRGVMPNWATTISCSIPSATAGTWTEGALTAFSPEKWWNQARHCAQRRVFRIVNALRERAFACTSYEKAEKQARFARASWWTQRESAPFLPGTWAPSGSSSTDSYASTASLSFPPLLTMLEAVEYGWWYAARLPDGRLAAAVASDPESIKSAALGHNDSWLERLRETNHMANQLSCCRFIDNSLVVCPAPSFLLDKPAGKGWLAVGDAASAYDPISSQGIHKALSDGLEAANAIAPWLDGGADKLAEYGSSVANRFDVYLKMRNFFYGVEKRWPASAFWWRRQERTTLQA